MKKKCVFLMMLTTALIWAGCSKTEVETPAPESNEIRLQSSVRDILPSTRRAYEGTDLSANPLTALVLTSLVAKNYTSPYCEGTMTFNSSGAVSYNKPIINGAYSFPGTSTMTYLTGLHPGTGWDTSTTPGTPVFNLTGKDDVMFAPEQSTSLQQVNSGTYATLPFTHQLTLMKLSFYGDVQSAGNVKVNAAELIKVNNAPIPATVEAAISSNTQALNFSGSTNTLACYAKDTDNPYSGVSYTLTGAAVEQAYILAPPVANAAGGNDEYTFRISYLDASNNPKAMDVNVDLKTTTGGPAFTGSTKGTAFNITFKFVGGQIEAQATVTDWVQGGSFEEEI